MKNEIEGCGHGDIGQNPRQRRQIKERNDESSQQSEEIPDLGELCDIVDDFLAVDWLILGILVLTPSSEGGENKSTANLKKQANSHAK